MLALFKREQVLNAVASIQIELKIVQNLSEIQPVNNLSDQKF
ncbi:hypothetical protein QUB68_26050 [Microcoleus sp. A006_D1]